MKAYHQLEELFTQAAYITHALNLLSWDGGAMMPPGGADIRAKSFTALTNVQRSMLSKPENLELVEQAKQAPSLDNWQSRNLALMKKQVRTKLAIPEKLLTSMTNHAVLTEQAWQKLRMDNNWTDFYPMLEKSVQYAREYTAVLGDTLGLSDYDALLDKYSPGLTQAIIDPIFATLKQELPALLATALEQQKTTTILEPNGPFAVSSQKSICLSLMQTIGFDFNHGRLDTSFHPFCGGDPEDIRITTRYSDHEFMQAILGTCHETGHAMYNFNLPATWRRQPVGQPLGMSIHESQSLIVEMHACRSPEFAEFLSPLLSQEFGNQSAFHPNNLYKLFTRVERSFIRTDADEVTYPFHVILRYELEKELISGKLAVKDLPDAWDSKMQSYLGISTQGNYRDGVMQDVHWPYAMFGYFPAYNFGSLLAAQFYHHAQLAHPTIPDEIKAGNFSSLNHWLNQHIRQFGSYYDTNELIEIATGETINPQHFLDHIKNRYCS